MESSTRDRLIEAGMAMLLARGYNGLGVAELLAETKLPKGSFYHHFESKEDFALAVVDRYMSAVHAGLDAMLGDPAVAPLQRIRNFFEATRESYRTEGYLGCLLGGIGQELSGASEVFRKRIQRCIDEIASKITVCLELAIVRGDLARGTNARHLANLLCDCWEGAALRSRLLRDPAPLGAMLDFYFGAVPASRPSRANKRRASTRAVRSRRT
jgi:TetR/AcrR family transcriptional repressor of nem operon